MESDETDIDNKETELDICIRDRLAYENICLNVHYSKSLYTS